MVHKYNFLHIKDLRAVVKLENKACPVKKIIIFWRKCILLMVLFDLIIVILFDGHRHTFMQMVRTHLFFWTFLHFLQRLNLSSTVGTNTVHQRHCPHAPVSILILPHLFFLV